MTDPVRTSDGQVYERMQIQQWFANGRNTSPITNIPLPNLRLTPEEPLRRAIDEYQRCRQEMAQKALEQLSWEAAAITLEGELRDFRNPQDASSRPMGIRSWGYAPVGLSAI